MKRRCFVLFLCLGWPALANGQYAVLGRQVACRDAPALSGEVVARLDVADLVQPAAEPSGETNWIHIVTGANLSCFVFAKLLTPFDAEAPELALKAIVRSTSQLTGRMPFGRMTTVADLFKNRWQGIRIEGSLEMELLRLQVLERTADAIHWSELRLPEVRQWAEQNRPPVFYFEPGGMYAVYAGTYWYLHDKYADHPWADSIAWVAAQRHDHHDCAGSMICWVIVTMHELGYIQRHPTGAYLPEALAHLAERLSHATGRTCHESSFAMFRGLFETYATALGRVDHDLARALEDTLYELRQSCIPE